MAYDGKVEAEIIGAETLLPEWRGSFFFSIRSMDVKLLKAEG